MNFDMNFSGAEAFTILAFVFFFGVWVGQKSEARRWRNKGNHEYMNRMASGGYLYEVKKEQ